MERKKPCTHEPGNVVEFTTTRMTYDGFVERVTKRDCTACGASLPSVYEELSVDIEDRIINLLEKDDKGSYDE